MGEEWLVLFSKIWYNISISQKRDSDNGIGANREVRIVFQKQEDMGKNETDHACLSGWM